MKDYKIMSITNGTASIYGEILIVKANPVNYTKGERNIYSTFSSIIDSHTETFFFDIDDATIEYLNLVAQSEDFWVVNYEDFECETIKNETEKGLGNVYVSKDLYKRKGFKSFFIPSPPKYRRVKQRSLRDFLIEKSCEIEFFKSGDAITAKLDTGELVSMDYQSSLYISKNDLGTIDDYFVLDVPCISEDNTKCIITKKDPYPMIFDIRTCSEISQLSLLGCSSKLCSIADLKEIFDNVSIDESYIGGVRNFNLSISQFQITLEESLSLQKTTIEHIREYLMQYYIWEDYSKHILYLDWLPF